MPVRRRPRAASPTVEPEVSRAVLDGERFLHYLKSECGMADNTLAAYGRDIGRFLRWLDQQHVGRIHDVTLERLSQYLKVLHEEGLAPRSIARHVVSIKMYFRYLMLEGILAESAADLLNSPKLWQYLPKVLGPERVEDLLRAPNRDDRFYLRDRAILAMMYATGCRASEVTGLEVADVHLEERHCRVLGKGNKERIVSLNPVAVAAVEAYLAHERPLLVRDPAQQTLFLTRSGQSLTRINLWKLVKKYARRIGCSADVSPHTLRHSFATHMLAGGAEIRALQEMLGHASIRTTQIYTQVDHSRIKSIHTRCHPRG